MAVNSFPRVMSLGSGAELNSINDTTLSFLMTLNMKLIRLQEMLETKTRILSPLLYILRLSLIPVGFVLMVPPSIMILLSIICLLIMLALNQVKKILHGRLLHIKLLALKVLHYGHRGSQNRN